MIVGDLLAGSIRRSSVTGGSQEGGEDRRRRGEGGHPHGQDSRYVEDRAGRERTLADCRGDAFVGALDHIPGSEGPRIRSAEVAVDYDPTVDAEVQLVAHQVDAWLASELEDDATDLEPPVLAGAVGPNLDPFEAVGPNERVEGPPGHLGDATLRADLLDEVPSRGEVGRAMNQRHRRSRLSERQRVEHGTVPTTEDRHRQAGEASQMRLDQVGHVSPEGPVGRVSRARVGETRSLPARSEFGIDACRRRRVRRRDRVGSPAGRAAGDHPGSRRGCASASTSASLPSGAGATLRTAWGIWSIWPPTLPARFEQRHVELDVEAFDGCAHARRPRPDHDHVVERFDVHPPTL